MDSLTQIVLGAACGELAMGKKIGNKALLFGAIGGTIPDLDVIIGSLWFHNEIDALAFHRGFMHSFLFALIAPPLIGYAVHWLYNRGKRFNTTTAWDWIRLFFLSVITHPILDSFTPYGTQLFTPFSDSRVAFNTISVVDPIYTLPFLLLMIALMFFKRHTSKRRFFLKAALGVSSFYLLLTVGNKLYIDSVFEDSLETAEIDFKRFRTQPTILNNLLWYGIAETPEAYYVGMYSILDTASGISNWEKLPKNHDLLTLEDEDLKTLVWFSDGYYNVFPGDVEGNYRYFDLRYPSFNAEDPNASIFSFILKKEGARWNALPYNAQPPSAEDFNMFWNRIKGI